MLFSEPKIPQYSCAFWASIFCLLVSVLFSEPKIPQSSLGAALIDGIRRFQCSSASRKFLNEGCHDDGVIALAVSVLFSEPKIPQFQRHHQRVGWYVRFSALQRAENSSIDTRTALRLAGVSFSALQRAENSSILVVERPELNPPAFQCSSASRKFLNRGRLRAATSRCSMFQCSSASRKFLNIPRLLCCAGCSRVSVLFSEPKIPQY